MSVKLTEREMGDVVIVDCIGSITTGEGAGSLDHKIGDLAKRGKKKVILNLAETFYVDSVGIGSLINGFTQLANHGAELKLLCLSKRVKNLLQLTSLYREFKCFDDETTAVRSFN